mgnify:CR=1 FL=1
MSWKKIIKQTELEAERGDDVQQDTITGPDRGDLSQAGARVAAGTYKDLIDKTGQLWVQIKSANVMDQKRLFGEMRKSIREANIPEA